MLKRVDAICNAAFKKGVTLYVDAEEYWIQDSIDALVNKMMQRYNTKSAVVFNTYQLYRHDRLQYLEGLLRACPERRLFPGRQARQGRLYGKRAQEEGH